MNSEFASRAHEVLASTGGKPKPKVEMMFRSTDGRPLRTAKFGDTVEFYVALTPDKAYHGISPKECMFSDREDMLSPDARHLTFVQSSCPVQELSEIIDPLANVNEEVYFSKFKTFRFGNQSTVFAQCTVQSCFKRISNSNLTAERLRFRHKRAPNPTYSKEDLVEQVSVRESLTILDEMETEEVSSRSTEHCLLSASKIPHPLMLSTIFLVILCIASITVAIYLGYRLRKKTKETSFDVYSVYSSSLSAAGPPTSSLGFPRHSYVHHVNDNYR
ncbi:hypothetical protein KIN20_029098 [Parelaphostrongylus tenuis]|uniref:ZP domain-containing protein n=1 Tax=Parelaphostrongylus tenuis TaxID=148309 RepID=A0AAD5WFC1_PARTN|nr:hypothetical protein KIN20_029098 [Parelaphostrongylus tenuis]